MNYSQLQKYCKSGTSNFVSFVWGLLEGIIFFIVPDVYIGFVSLFDAKNAILSLLYALAGSLVSAIIIFSFPSQSASLLNYIPGINNSMLVRVSSEFKSFGPSALLKGPLEGIPYKVYSITAAKSEISLSSYILWSIPSRLERTALVLIIGILINRVFKVLISRRPNLAITAHICLWVGLYTFYFLSIN